MIQKKVFLLQNIKLTNFIEGIDYEECIDYWWSWICRSSHG